MPDTQTTSSSIPLETADAILLLACILIVIPASSAIILWGILPLFIGQ